MSWRDAPLYIEAHDLAAWTIARVGDWSVEKASILGARVSDHACDLLCAVSLSLTFPETRALHLRRADECIVCLRMELRLAGQLGLLSARRLRFASQRLRVIGKMVGGWRKRVESKSESIAEAPF